MNLIQNEGTIKVYETLTIGEISPKASNGIRWLRWKRLILRTKLSSLWTTGDRRVNTQPFIPPSPPSSMPSSARRHDSERGPIFSCVATRLLSPGRRTRLPPSLPIRSSLYMDQVLHAVSSASRILLFIRLQMRLLNYITSLCCVLTSLDLILDCISNNLTSICCRSGG